LEGVDLSGASGVLVNITASRKTLKLKETSEAVNTVRTFAAKEAEIIFGTVYDDNLGDAMRVTVVATGLGRSRQSAARPTIAVNNNPLQMLRTGTDNLAMAAGGSGVTAAADFGQLDVPAVWRNSRESAAARVSALEESGMDRYEIPAFLRKQAD
jgi:cell division protein FtsZ